MDRFDCQYLMATFVNVYISSFIRNDSPQKLLQQVNKFIQFKAIKKKTNIYLYFCKVYSLKPELQLELFTALRDSLASRGILQINAP